MARTKKKPGPGHNSTMSQEDQDALALHHLTKLRAQDAEVAKAKSVLDGAKSILNDMYAEAKLDGFTKKELAEVLVDSRARHRDLAEEERRRVWLRGLAGLPVGTQMDLFSDATPTLVRDEMFWRADGYQSGLRADEPSPPEDCGSTFTQAWMEGYHDGQAHNGRMLARAGEIIAARGPNANADTKDLNGEGDGDEAGEPEVDLDEEARRLRRSGFMERSADELDAPAGEEAPALEGADA